MIMRNFTKKFLFSSCNSLIATRKLNLLNLFDKDISDKFLRLTDRKIKDSSNTHLLQFIEGTIENKRNHFENYEITSIISSLVSNGIFPKRLFCKLQTNLEGCIEDLIIVKFSKLLYSLCYANYLDENQKLLNEIIDFIEYSFRMKTTNYKCLLNKHYCHKFHGNLCFFFCLHYEETKHLHTKLLNNLLKNLGIDYSNFNKKNFKYIYHFLLRMQIKSKEKNVILEDLVEKFPFYTKIINMSTIHKKIFNLIKENIHWDSTIHYEYNFKNFIVDIFIEPNIIIEINGPSHFTEGHFVNGFFKVRNENLRLLKYKVIEISTYELELVDHKLYVQNMLKKLKLFKYDNHPFVKN